MSETVAVQTIYDRALDYADMTGSSYPVQARVLNYMDYAVNDLYDLLVDMYQDYNRATSSVTLVSGTESYSLPSDFYKALGVYFQTGSNKMYSLRQYERKEVDGYTRGPLSSGTVVIEYVPRLESSDLPTGAGIGGNVTIYSPLAWVDYVAMMTAKRLLMREESDTSALDMEIAYMRDRFERTAQIRNEGDTGRVQDTYDRWGVTYHDYAFSKDLRYRIMGDSIYFVESQWGGY